MQEAILISPVAQAYASKKPVFGQVNNTETALMFGTNDIEEAHNRILGICDVSSLQRFGIKGPQAEKWLQTAGIRIPEKTNSWVFSDCGCLVMRLGNTEFLLEAQPGNIVTQTLDEIPAIDAGVHKVIRNDAGFIISGELVSKLFSEVSSIDLLNGALDGGRLVMTVIAGVSATLIKQDVKHEAVYRIWCDGTLGPYLWKALLEIIEEHGGGPVGFNYYYSSN